MHDPLLGRPSEGQFVPQLIANQAGASAYWWALSRPSGRAGAALVRRAERIETQLLAARKELDDIAGLRSGTLRIGTFPTAGYSLLPPVVKLFKSRYPAIALTLRSARFTALRMMLDTREIEVSLLWDYAWAPVAPRRPPNTGRLRQSSTGGPAQDRNARTRRRAMDYP
jgi:DNA-binding transcriptional LysR family regulator